MDRATLIVSVFAVAACSSSPPRAAQPRPAALAESLYDRVPARMGDFELTERTAVGTSGDSLYRYRDGSATRVSVILYEVEQDIRFEPDSQTWTAREGAKFPAVQEELRRRGQITSYVVAFSDTARISNGDRQLVEHSTGVPVRWRNGTISVELQYLYLIGGKFVKVRATVPEPGWRQTKVPSFARELAWHLAEGSAR